MRPDCPQCRLPGVRPMTMPDDWGQGACRGCRGARVHHDLNGGVHACPTCGGTGKIPIDAVRVGDGLPMEEANGLP